MQKSSCKNEKLKRGLLLILLFVWMRSTNVWAEERQPERAVMEVERSEAGVTEEKMSETEFAEIETKEQHDVRETVKQRAFYEGTEGIYELPTQITVEVEREGESYEVACAETRREVMEEYWSDTFAFVITYHDYDAEYFRAGEETVIRDGDSPYFLRAAGAYDEEMLLSMLGLSSADYRIREITWDGEPYQDASGVRCRDAIARGEKRLRDYQIWYEGEGAVRTDEEPKSENREEMQVMETKRERGLDTLRRERMTLRTYLERMSRFLRITIGIGVLCAFLGAIVLLVLTVRSRKKRQKP